MMNAVDTTAGYGPEEIQAPAPPPRRETPEGRFPQFSLASLLLQFLFVRSLFNPFFGVRPAFNAGFLSVLRFG